VQHWPGAAIVLSLALFSGIFLFLPALLADKLRETDNRSKKVIYILGTIGLVCYMAGLFFKIQHWPLSTILLMLGMAIIFFIVFPWYTWITWKEENNVSVSFICMVIGSLAIGIPSLLITMNLQRNYDGGYYMHQSEQQALYTFRFSENQAFVSNCHDSVALPVLTVINSKTNELLKVINDIEAKMIAESEGIADMPAVIEKQIIQTGSGPEIQFSNLRSPFHTAPFQDFLMEGSASRTELNATLKEYSDYLLGLTSGDDFSKYEKLLDPSVYLPAIDPANQRVSLMSGLHMLELMKNSILTVESLAFTAVSKRK